MPTDRDAMSDDRNAHFARLLGVLDTIGFATSYYRYCDAHQARGFWRDVTPDDVAAALETTTPLHFTFKKKERFFTTSERASGLLIGLNLRVLPPTVEAILVLRTAAGHIGAPFAILAWEEMRQRVHDYEHPSAAPRFSNAAELADAMRFVVDLFEEVKRAILATDWGDCPAAGKTAPTNEGTR